MLILSHQTYFLLQVLVSLFISSYSLFIETNLSRLLFALNEALEVKTSTLFNLVFGSDTTLSCSFLFFLITDLKFLIFPVILQIIFVALKFAIPIGLRIKEAKETHPLTTQEKISKC